MLHVTKFNIKLLTYISVIMITTHLLCSAIHPVELIVTICDLSPKVRHKAGILWSCNVHQLNITLCAVRYSTDSIS
jgi:hypothetical protein